MRTVDPALPAPLYHQLAEVLRGDIRGRRLRPGDFFTTEEALERRFDVSKVTVRRALEDLADEGLVVRRTGKGTFVARPEVRVELPRLLSFTEEIARLGRKPGSRVLGARAAPASPEAAEELEIRRGARALRLERVRTADGEPMVHLVDWLPMRLKLDPAADFTGSLYARLEASGVTVDSARHVIEAGLAGPAVARHLGVRASSPVLRFRRTTYDARRRPVVFETAACRADLYRYEVRLRRRAAMQG